jgi:hypothetical protein
MKLFFVLVAAMLSVAPALAAPPSTEAFARQLVSLAKAAPGEYRDRYGAVAYDDPNVVVYALSTPTPEIPADRALVRVAKNGQRPYLHFAFDGVAGTTTAQALFLPLRSLFAGAEAYKDFTTTPGFVPLADGREIGVVYYRDVAVAKMILSAKHDAAVLMIGFVESDSLIADLVTFAGGPAPLVEPKTWGSATADEVMRLYHSAARNFEGILGAAKKRPDGTEYFEGPSLLGADESWFYRSNLYGLTLTLTYRKSNRGRAKIEKEVRALYVALLKTGHFQVDHLEETDLRLMENDRDVLALWTSPTDDTRSLEIVIYHSLPVADEANDHGEFPSELTDTAEPQVVEVRGQGTAADSYLRCNGVFREGILVQGYKTYHGYSDFLDGVWYSNYWPTLYGSYEVVFHPAYSRDTVIGRFHDGGDMSRFELDSLYDLKNSPLRPATPGWALTTLAAHQKKTDDAKLAEADRSAVSREGFPYRHGSSPSAVEKEIFATLDRLIQQASGDFRDLKGGGRPAYALTDDVQDAPPLSQADRHYILADHHYSPGYVAVWGPNNPDVETAFKAVRHYMQQQQKAGQGKVITESGRLRFDTPSADIAVHGVWLDYAYNEGKDPLFTVKIGRREDYTYVADRPSAPSDYSASSTATPRQSVTRYKHQCPTCGGRGRVMKTDAFGHSASDVCPTCNGQREVY